MTAAAPANGVEIGIDIHPGSGGSRQRLCAREDEGGRATCTGAGRASAKRSHRSRWA